MKLINWDISTLSKDITIVTLLTTLVLSNHELRSRVSAPRSGALYTKRLIVWDGEAHSI